MLYVVSTPIGNREDITLRAIRILKEVDLIAAEDTRHTGQLLKHLEVETPQTSYHEHNKVAKTKMLLQHLQQGRSLALVSDAGTPGVSDPGYYLIREAQLNDIPVTCIPGATALIPALVLSGCPVDQFQFLGFLSPKAGKKKRQLEALKGYDKTVILYESPYKVKKTLQAMLDVLGDIPVTLCRELTKLHEEVVSRSVAEWLQLFESKDPKGEYVVVFVP